MSRRVKYKVTDFKLDVPRAKEVTEDLINIKGSALPASEPFTFASSTWDRPFEKTEIVEIRKLPTAWRETFKIKLRAKTEYTPCDAIGLLVPNSDDLVERVLRKCDHTEPQAGGRRIQVERTGPNGFIFDGTLKDFIKYRMDLKTIPRKRLLLELAKNAEKSRDLEYLCSTEGSSDYMGLGIRMNTLCDILDEFGCRPAMEGLLAYCETTKPRYYSLVQDSGCDEILLGVISKEVDGSFEFGHISNFILNEYDLDRDTYSIPVEYCVRKSVLFGGFTSRSVICFCTGTGIAPFIAFYRKYFKDGSITNLKLVYGFRSEQDNLLQYYEDIECDVILAESSKGKHVYDFVNAIAEYKEDCNVFLCGNMNMQRDTFLKIRACYPDLVAEKRIYFDNWT